MKVKLILTPRLAKTWVHFDHLLVDVESNKECGYMRSESSWGYGSPPFPSFQHDMPIEYIASADKKNWRKTSGWGRWDGEMKVEDFSKREWVADHRGKITEISIVEVVVKNPVYIDPKTATVWRYREIEQVVYSKRAWLFKQMPNPEITPIWFMDNNSFWYRKKNTCDTAFLSGDLLKKLCSWGEEVWGEDPRKFLYDNTKQDKSLIVKSLSRQLKKLIKSVKPISEQTKNFFKLAGAFKHLKQQKQKYAY